MQIDTLTDLFTEQLKDLYSAENQLAKALPKMAKKGSSPSLVEAFKTHLDETKRQIDRLQSIGEIAGIKLTGKKCKAMEGLIEEGKEVLEEEGHESVIDAALIAAAHRIEHYEISAYTTVCTIAETLGNEEVFSLLQETLEEEIKTGEILTNILKSEVLAHAPHNDEDPEAPEEDEDVAPSPATKRRAKK